MRAVLALALLATAALPPATAGPLDDSPLVAAAGVVRYEDATCASDIGRVAFVLNVRSGSGYLDVQGGCRQALFPHVVDQFPGGCTGDWTTPIACYHDAPFGGARLSLALDGTFSYVNGGVRVTGAIVRVA